MGVSAFQNPSFVWVCAALAGGCLTAAVAVGARAFWAELAARFLRMPAASKAALVAFVAVATAVAQKPGNVATDSHGLGGAVLSTDYTDLHGLGTVVLSTDVTDSHGLGEAVLSTDYTDLHGLGESVLDPVNPVHPVKETPYLPTSSISALSDSNISAVMSTNSTTEEIRDNPCQSVVHLPINAQLELFPSGNFIARSNAVERVYRRVNPDDWDDDGIPNDEDDDPRIAANETQFGPHQTLPFEQSLAAGEDLSFKIRYRSVKESGAADDIKVTATFVENETEWEQESRDSATAVKVTVKPKVHAPALVCSLALCGCGERTYTEDEQNEKAARSLISALSTNASVRAIRSSGAVRECLKRLTTRHERETLLVSWRDALKNIQIEKLRPSERYWSVREACHVLVWDVVCSLQDSGGSYEEMWQSYLDTLAWLDSQIAKMKPGIDGRCERRKAHECWDSYQALAEYRESVIENLEIDEFDKGRYPNDVDKMDAIRAKFEKLIGRPVRKREDITRLGFYAKQARARIQAERDAALGTTRR